MQHSRSSPDARLNVSVRISNFKAFGESPQGFDEILPINLIVGRNNSGKSSLIDMIEMLGNMTLLDRAPSRFNAKPTLHFESTAESLHIEQSGLAPGDYRSLRLTWTASRSHPSGRRCIGASIPGIRPQILSDITKRMAVPLENRKFRRLLSDRNILVEPLPEHGTRKTIAPDGSGTAALIASFITNALLPREVVQDTMLEGLNAVFTPDEEFEEIGVQQVQNDGWEVFVAQRSGPLIPLTSMGSGLRTVLLVLANLHLVPAAEDSTTGDYVFAFEELENNLHPAVQRRLLSYIAQQVCEAETYAFITTHSNPVIDLFTGQTNSQLVHIRSEGSDTVAFPVSSFADQSSVLDDLDVRASDLLQSNCVVWVEGPSDRIYFNRWVELVTRGGLREGKHYQCVFYGGSLISHLSGRTQESRDDNSEIDDLIRVLSVNRHAIFLVDSDRSRAGQPLDGAKMRVLEELESSGTCTWVTEGREIENYIPKAALRRLYRDTSLQQPAKFAYFDRYLEGVHESEGRRFLRSKARYAVEISRFIDESSLHERGLDLMRRLNEVTARIKGWNA